MKQSSTNPHDEILHEMGKVPPTLLRTILILNASLLSDAIICGMAADVYV